MILAAWAPAALVAPASSVSDCRPADCVAGLTAADLFAVAAKAQADGKPDQAETILRALLQDPDVDIRAEARFRLGKLRLERGDASEAAALFSRILEERPNAAPVRLEYARALTAMGRNDAALRQLQRAQAIGLPEEIRRAVDRISSALRSTKRWGGSVEVGLAPDSNINQATSQQAIEIFGIPFQLSEDARAKSKVGATFAGQLYGRVPLSPNVNMLGTLATEGVVYDFKSQNDVAVTASVGPEFSRQFRPAIMATRRWYAGRAYSYAYGASLRVVRPLDGRTQIDASGSIQKSRHEFAQDQNATLWSSNLTLERAWSPTLFGRLSLFGATSDAVTKAYGYDMVGGEVVISKDFGPLSAYGRLNYSHLGGKAPFVLFGAKRNDDRIEASAGLSWRRVDIFGANPVVRLTHSRNNSTLMLYEFKRTRLEMALSRPF